LEASHAEFKVLMANFCTPSLAEGTFVAMDVLYMEAVNKFQIQTCELHHIVPGGTWQGVDDLSMHHDLVQAQKDWQWVKHRRGGMDESFYVTLATRVQTVVRLTHIRFENGEFGSLNTGRGWDEVDDCIERINSLILKYE
jgi:hypothetical protein